MSQKQSSTWFITGCSSGFGRELARAVVVRGYRAAVTAQNPGQVEDIVAGHGDRAVALPLDVTNPAQVTESVRRAEEHFGGIDVLVNNAGLGGTANLVDMTDEQWSSVLDVTLTGTMRMTRAALQHMMPRGSGVIVNNASVVGWRAQEGQSHYAAAKAGVMALTRCAALEAAKSGVRINAVARMTQARKGEQ